MLHRELSCGLSQKINSHTYSDLNLDDSNVPIYTSFKSNNNKSEAKSIRAVTKKMRTPHMHLWMHYVIQFKWSIMAIQKIDEPHCFWISS